MQQTPQGKDRDQLIEAILEGIQRIKGLDIVKIDLTKINHSECNYFIICHGNSTTQVDAIAHSVENTVEEMIGESAWHKDGYQNSLWVLLDYADVMVHVFQHETRKFYDLENLWADAAIEKIQTEN
ncbi:ribosome silencing factor [Sunxiuqinia elliptica]|uniref:Ribosomal silencing factor RsfS n=1 Tax=Sunxiuqinia elliptica TaxID=655355 RepID=A0A1I2K6V4_9BACT|nr:ribosome silencing factor [Sunxiuqinia elliptica]TDN96273.1 ribosome-associated protein [Sunxiuqinia elliptica]TDO67984.1 ribosome-associated protein [Sunxiuqinia elliptica]SFF62852.1 ribosome-associated protein [Sunxiuqinia elliptica]